HFWFLEVLVWGHLGLVALLLVPAFDRWQRRHRFGAAVTVLVACLALRHALVGRETALLEEYAVGVAVWCMALGWAAAEARGWWQQAVVLLLGAVGLAGFFGDDPQRETIVAIGFVLLLLARPVLLPRPFAAVVLVLAHASFWIYLTHWQVYADLEAAGHPWLALLASLALGVATSWVHDRARSVLAGRRTAGVR
ncbi:MAG: AMP-dependent synthetase and ligase, partial [Nocardioides sp.]|nr:AMP-dependent synthetase and ligase [Nocardioides sp.]